MADLVRQETHSWSRFAQTVKRLSHICLEICHPYQLDNATCHLRAARCLVSFWFYFEYNCLLANCVYPDLTPRSAASNLDLLCFPMSLLWDASYIWFNTVRFYCNSGNHRHIFSEEPANQIHLSYFYSYFCNAKRNKVSHSHIRLVSSRGYKAYPAVHSGDAFSCTIPCYAYNGVPEM